MTRRRRQPKQQRAPRNKHARTVAFTAIVAVVVIGILYLNRTNIQDMIGTWQRPSLPKPVSYVQILPEDELRQDEEGVDRLDQSAPTSTIEEAEFLLDVPFMSQAPHANWDLPYQEACEEASVLMIAAYYSGESGLIPIDDADARILNLVAYQEASYGFYEDTSATETKRFIEDIYPNLQAKILPLGSVDDIKHYIRQGIPVMLPADGTTLPNPNFRNGGPLYHMLVVRGFTETHFITNDPGTRNGENFLYTYNGLLDAVHDWNNGDVPHGVPIMMIVTPRDEPYEDS